MVGVDREQQAAVRGADIGVAGTRVEPEDGQGGELVGGLRHGRRRTLWALAGGVHLFRPLPQPPAGPGDRQREEQLRDHAKSGKTGSGKASAAIISRNSWRAATWLSPISPNSRLSIIVRPLGNSSR